MEKNEKKCGQCLKIHIYIPKKNRFAVIYLLKMTTTIPKLFQYFDIKFYECELYFFFFKMLKIEFPIKLHES